MWSCMMGDFQISYAVSVKGELFLLCNSMYTGEDNGSYFLNINDVQPVLGKKWSDCYDSNKVSLCVCAF